MVPKAKFNRADGQTGAKRPSSKGISVIIGPAEKGPLNKPIAVAKDGVALAMFGNGALANDEVYVRHVSGNTTVLIRAAASTPGEYGAVTVHGAGTSVVTTSETALPLVDANVLVTFPKGGTVGTAGATYTVSLDGGTTPGAVMALGTANKISIPDTGMEIDLAAGTILAGQTVSFKATGPLLTTNDISDALEGLRVSTQGWEWIYVTGHESTAATVALFDTWLAGLESGGRFRGFTTNSRFMGDAESEADFATAMATAFDNATSIRGGVCVDGGDGPGDLPGKAYVRKRPAALATVGRLMKISYGRDAAYIEDGPVPGFQLPDDDGNPKNHDENFFEGPSNHRLIALRTVPERVGTYINDPVAISPVGSDYVYLQHIRTMNRALEIAYGVVTGQLSSGIRKDVNPAHRGPNGEVYAAEEDLLGIEAMVARAQSELEPEVSGLKFTLSRTDDVGANGPVILTGTQEVSSKVYVKGFEINATFVRTISIAA